MSEWDLVVRGGRVLTPGGIVRADIGVRNGRIAAISPKLKGTDNVPVLECGGHLVMPGLVDVHTHLRDPGFPEKEDFYSGTAAAASAGVTTVVAQPNTNPPIVDAESFLATRRIGEARAVVDFGIAAAATESNLSDLPALVAAGAVSIDFALGGSSPALTVRSNAALVAILEAVRELEAVATVFAADAEVSGAARDRLEAVGRKDPLAFADAYPAATEVVGLGRVLAAALATGARVHMRQLSCRESVQVLEAWRPLLGERLTAEVTPHHLYLTREALVRLGTHAVAGPPLREEADTQVMQEALRAGLIDIVATDHAPHRLAEKEAGADNVWLCPPGFPGLETLLPSLLAAVNRGELSLERVAAITAEQPARIFGLYPQKGVIAVGSDADLVLVDEKAPLPIDPGRFFTKARYSPFAGEILRGRVLRTLVRGRVVYETGAPDNPILVKPGFGRFVAPGMPERGVE